MGDDIYVGDIEKEISKIDGVINLIELRVYNERGEGYSPTSIQQETYTYTEQQEDGVEEVYGDETSVLIDTAATDGILYSGGDSLFEIKYPDTDDIRVRVKER